MLGVTLAPITAEIIARQIKDGTQRLPSLTQLVFLATTLRVTPRSWQRYAVIWQLRQPPRQHPANPTGGTPRRDSHGAHLYALAIPAACPT
jgi:hypothetical protein